MTNKSIFSIFLRSVAIVLLLAQTFLSSFVYVLDGWTQSWVALAASCGDGVVEDEEMCDGTIWCDVDTCFCSWDFVSDENGWCISNEYDLWIAKEIVSFEWTSKIYELVIEEASWNPVYEIDLTDMYPSDHIFSWIVSQTSEFSWVQFIQGTNSLLWKDWILPTWNTAVISIEFEVPEWSTSANTWAVNACNNPNCRWEEYNVGSSASFFTDKVDFAVEWEYDLNIDKVVWDCRDSRGWWD